MSMPSPTGRTEPEHRKHARNDPIAFLSNLKTLWPDDPSHPAWIALRTYSLSLLLSLGPAVLPVAVDLITRSSSRKTRLDRFRRVSRHELSFTGFPFAITVAVVGGVAFTAIPERNNIQRQSVVTSTSRRHAAVLSLMPNLTPSQKTFLSNVLSSAIALFLLQRTRQSKPGSRRPSPTFELTLLFACRAADTIIQHLLCMKAARKAYLFNFSTHHSRELTGASKHSSLVAADGDRNAKEWHQRTSAWLDAVLFWACSARYLTSSIFEIIRLIYTNQNHVVFLLPAAQVHNNEVNGIYV